MPLGNHQGLVLLLLLLTISYFLNQKLWVVNLTDSQGLGMQKQIQGTDELQMWTGLKEFGIFLGCQVLAFLIITIIIVLLTCLGFINKNSFPSSHPLRILHDFRNPQ